MKNFVRITSNPEIMGGKPCIRGMRVTVGMLVGLVLAGYSTEQIRQRYPYVDAEDVKEAMAVASQSGALSRYGCTAKE